MQLKVYRTLVALLLLALIVVLSAPANHSASASPTAAKFDYLFPTAGSCMAGGAEGQGVIDMRNGNVYCVPTNGGAPIPQGHLNFAAIH